MASTPGVERDVLTVEEAAARLGISRRHAYEAVARGEIPSKNVGRRIVIPKTRFEQWLNES